MQKFIATVCGIFLITSLGYCQATVSGVGTVYAKPDCAHLSFDVTTEHESASKAHAKNSEYSSVLFDRLRKANIDDKDVSTVNFSVSPKHFYPKEGEPKLVGYTVLHRLSVKVNDLSKVGSLIDNTVSDNVHVVSVHFAISDRIKLEDQARVLALKDAKKKAKILVSGLDGRLGKLVSVNEYVESPRTGIYRAEASVQDTAPGRTSVAAGEQAITVRVNAVWEVIDFRGGIPFPNIQKDEHKRGIDSRNANPSFQRSSLFYNMKGDFSPSNK